ncbi:MAG: LysM peptidoglycan-binding domain-containing protein [Bacillota bacterium]|nr:LysM peptidoglycan-binding domain-containing protein [Bacillota bacterium]
MKRKYRIKSKGRFLIFLTVVMVIVLGATGTALGEDFGRPGAAQTAYVAVEISAGDTLWDLALEYGPENQDVRKIVHAICQQNDIRAGEIYPGQTILIPQAV